MNSEKNNSLEQRFNSLRAAQMNSSAADNSKQAAIPDGEHSEKLINIKDFNWDFKRIWTSVAGEKTINGFSYSDNGDTLIIRNDFFEIAEAQQAFNLEPFSEYTFSVDTKIINFVRHPQDIIDHPDYPGGTVALYQSSKGDELVRYTTAIKNDSPEWKPIEWKVHTNAATRYGITLANGSSWNACKGIAYFKNLKWEKSGEIKKETENASPSTKRADKEIVFSDGSRYKGEQTDGKPNGQGKLTIPSIGVSFEGTFKDGNIHGHGKSIMPNGAEYIGEFKNGVMHGYGKYRYADGIIYEGNFVNGVRSGKGKSTTPDGMVDEGEMSDGKMNGKGKRTFPEGGYYQGDFSNGKPHGQGILVLPNGKSYKGEFVEGKPKGGL